MLIVDDEEDLVFILADTLESRGYQVESAYSTRGAMEKIEGYDAQVALLDIRLGYDSGIDLLAKLKQVHPEILCVMMTAYATMDSAVEAIHRGAYDYLQKPLDVQYLLTTLDRCFDKLQLESEKARVEEALRVRNAELASLQHLLQNITDSMPSALITLDPNGGVLTHNPAAETLTGHDAALTRGQLLWHTCPEMARYRGLCERVIQDGQAIHLHREEVVAKHRTVYRDVDVFPLADNDVEGIVLRIDDVTQRVQMEEMMLQSAKMASVGRLAAGVAHEINNPLGAMMQSAQVLQMALDTQRPRTRQRLQEHGVDPTGLGGYLEARGLIEYLTGIREAGARAANIVSDLLTFSRKSFSKVASHDLNSLLEQALALAATDYDLKKQYDFREIVIVRELAPCLPPVMCDGQQIQQVILNLVHNAAQAMAEKREQRKIEYKPRLILRTAQREGPENSTSEAHTCVWLRLEVVDNGPGISETARAHLFEPFFTSKGVGEGTGLGLWLCWSIIVERHKGQIWVESITAGGSRFVIELPAEVEQQGTIDG